ncbi:MAG: hypothetical protein ABW039_10025 [Sphingobium sp.]
MSRFVQWPPHGPAHRLPDHCPYDGRDLDDADAIARRVDRVAREEDGPRPHAMHRGAVPDARRYPGRKAARQQVAAAVVLHPDRTFERLLQLVHVMAVPRTIQIMFILNDGSANWVHPGSTSRTSPRSRMIIPDRCSTNIGRSQRDGQRQIA